MRTRHHSNRGASYQRLFDDAPSLLGAAIAPFVSALGYRLKDRVHNLLFVDTTPRRVTKGECQSRQALSRRPQVYAYVSAFVSFLSIPIAIFASGTTAVPPNVRT